MIKKLIICGFPGVGKSAAANRCMGACDCESTSFHYYFDPTEVNAKHPFGTEKENGEWVKNYVDYIVTAAEENSKYQYILISSHEEVRNELIKRFVPYVVVVPEKSLKDEYLARYVKRGDRAEFIMNIYECWDEWLDAIDKDAPAVIHLKAGQFLSDILPIPK